MFFRYAPRLGIAAMVLALGLALGSALGSVLGVALGPAQPAFAQTPPASAARPDAPAAPAPETAAEDTTLTAKTIVFIKGSGTWDSAFDTISGAFKKLKTYADKEGLKADGPQMTIFTSTDDTGFQYQAALPVVEAPKTPPRGDIAVGQSPEGRAIKFIHHGSYDELDNTYEAITNYLDEKRLEAKDMFIEQYVTDLATADETKLTINVFVLIK